MQAYHAFVRPLSRAERDRFYAEAAPAARLYGAVGAPTSEAEQERQFQAMAPKLERSAIVFEFLDIMRRTAALPAPLRPLQNLFIRAGVELVPQDIRETLGLGDRYGLRSWERRLIALAGRAADRLVLTSAPPSQACVRMGLPADHLYRRA